MVNIKSPLASRLDVSNRSANTGKDFSLFLSETSLGSLFQVSGWQDFADIVTPALKELGFNGLGNYKTAQTTNHASCFRTAPDKLLIRHSKSAILEAVLGGLNSASSPITDLSHARWAIEINGPATEALLARLAPIDFSITNFPEGDFVQTGIHHVGVIIYRVSHDNFQIIVPVTWANTIWEFICDNAAVFNYSTIISPE